MTSFPGASHAFLTSRLTSPPEETLNERLVQYATYAGKAAQVSLRKQFANAVKTESKTVLPPSTPLDKIGQQSHCPRSTPPQSCLLTELK